MKRWLIVIGVVFALLIPTTGAFAAEFPREQIISEGNGRDWLEIKNPDGSHTIFTVPSPGYFFKHSETQLKASSNYYQYHKTKDGTGYEMSGTWNRDTFTIPYAAGAVILTSSQDVYTDYTKSAVFFSKRLIPLPPPPKPVVQGKVEHIPNVILKNLKDGGILLVALTIFSIMLGVSLVKRLPYSFLR
jgi:hypothetical protein